jgi:hypothetical protein
MGSRGIAAAVIIASSGALLACRHRPQADAIASPPGPDRLVGIVSVTGTGFEQQTMLRADQHRVVRLIARSEPDSASLARVGGTQIVVFGRDLDENFDVASFTVTSVDGAAVEDGILVRADGHLTLQSTIHAIPLGNPPAAFDSLVGARMWIGGPLATGPNVYGIISPPP